jgi:hypothetical protein
MSGVDTLYHFAGITVLPVNQVDPQIAYGVNVGIGNILEAARRSGFVEPFLHLPPPYMR